MKNRHKSCKPTEIFEASTISQMAELLLLISPEEHAISEAQRFNYCSASCECLVGVSGFFVVSPK